MEISIKEYIEERLPEFKDKVSPVLTTELDDLRVVYSSTHISGGHVKESQMEIKVMDGDYDACKEAEKKLLSILDMEEDAKYQSYKDIVFHSQVAGGGTIFNDGCQKWENSLIFMITWRYRNGKK